MTDIRMIENQKHMFLQVYRNPRPHIISKKQRMHIIILKVDINKSN